MLEKVKEVVARVGSNEGTLFTYAFAYSLIVGLAPFIIIAVVFVGTYVFTIDQVMGLLARYVPSDLIEPFVTYISHSDLTNVSLLITLLTVSVWVASKSIYSFLLLSSEEDGFDLSHVFLRFLSVVYFVIFVVALIALGFVISFVPLPTTYILPGFLFFFFLFFYRILSFNHIRLSQLVLGSAFTSIALVAVGNFFFIYINSFSNYESIYGPLASFMIVLISTWIISWVVFVGYCINTVFGKTNDVNSIKIFDKFNRS